MYGIERFTQEILKTGRRGEEEFKGYVKLRTLITNDLAIQ